jgi:hypothetical protein
MEGVEEQEAGRVILDLCTAIEVLTDVGDESPDSEAKRAWRNGCRWMAGAPLEEAPKARPRAPEAASAEGSQEEPPAGLVWTKEKPKVDGFYWYRVPGQAKQSIDLVQLFTGSPCWWSHERAAWVPITWDLEWAGPITEPAAPAAPQEGDTNQGDKA